MQHKPRFPTGNDRLSLSAPLNVQLLCTEARRPSSKRKVDSALPSAWRKVTINADHHELMNAFHKPTDEKRMVVIQPESTYGDWLDATADQSMEFMRHIRLIALSPNPSPLWADSGYDHAFQKIAHDSKIVGLAACLVMFVASTASAETMTGVVVGVADGDTVTLLVNGHDQIHVRVMGIDAPEKKQAFGKRSKQAMSDCAFGKQSQVEWNKKDRYGRTVGKVTVDNIDCGLRQIGLGLAWHYKAFEREQRPEDRKSYAQAESIAKSADIGLWSERDPVPPWDFRHGKR